MNNFNKPSTLSFTPLPIVKNTDETNTASYLCYKFNVLKKYKQIKEDFSLEIHDGTYNNVIYIYNGETKTLNIPISDFEVDAYLNVSALLMAKNSYFTTQILIAKGSIHKMKTFEEFFWLVEFIKAAVIDKSKDFNYKEMIIADDKMNISFKLIEFDTHFRAIIYKRTKFVCNINELCDEFVKSFGGLKLVMKLFWDDSKTISLNKKFNLTTNQFLEIEKLFLNSQIDFEAFDLKLYNECKYNTISIPAAAVGITNRVAKPYPLQVYELMGWLSFNAYSYIKFHRIKDKTMYDESSESRSIYDFYIEQGYNYTSNRKDSKEISELQTGLTKGDNDTFLNKLNNIQNLNISYHGFVEEKVKTIIDRLISASLYEIKEKDLYNLSLGNFFNFDFSEQNKFLTLNNKNLNFANSFFDTEENENEYTYYHSNTIDSSDTSEEEEDYFDNDDDDYDDNEDSGIEAFEEEEYHSSNAGDLEEASENCGNGERNIFKLNTFKTDKKEAYSQFSQEIKFPVFLKSKSLKASFFPKSPPFIIDANIINKPFFKKVLKEISQIVVSSFMKALKSVWSEESCETFAKSLEVDLTNEDISEQSQFLNLFSMEVPIFLFLPTLTKLFFDLKGMMNNIPTPESLLFSGKKKNPHFRLFVRPQMEDSVFITVMKINYNRLIDHRLNSAFKCRKCSNKLCLKENLLSVDYTGLFGKCVLMGPKVFNVNYINERLTEMITATYVVKDITCGKCGSYLGWVYLDSTNSSYSYKKNLKIFETKAVCYD